MNGKTNTNKLKIEINKMLRAGLDSDAIAVMCKTSKHFVKEVEAEYIKDMLESGAGQRARIRNMLVRNTPQMINVLFKAATQDVDSKLQLTAAQSFLSFAAKYLKDDDELDKSANKAAGAGLKQSLFDFVIPGEENQSSELQSGVNDFGYDNDGVSSEAGEYLEDDFDVTPDDLL